MIAAALLLLIPQLLGTERLPKRDITPELRQRWRAVLKWDDDCEESFESPDGKWGGVRFYSFRTSVYLVEVSCARGAYQGSQTYFVWDERTRKTSARRLQFTSYEIPRDTPQRTCVTELWGKTQFDIRTRILTIENDDRGQGDCGSRARYRISPDGPSLVEFRAKVECDGRQVDPSRWPALPIGHEAPAAPACAKTVP